MISNELVSDIYGYDDVAHIQGEENIFISRFNNPAIIINKYILANDCKTWANKHGYTIIDYIDIDEDELWTCKAYSNGLDDIYDYGISWQLSSPISIFKVCEWIRNNKR